jgi:hypothetical protein
MNKECRICLEDINDISNKLITPCLCKGSCRYVHEGCLGIWRKIDNLNCKTCPTCKYNYKYEKDIIVDIYNFILNNSLFVGFLLLIIFEVIYGFIFVKFIFYLGIYDVLEEFINDKTYIIILIITSINMYHMLSITIFRSIKNRFILTFYVLSLTSLLLFPIYYFFDFYRYTLIYNIIIYTPMFIFTNLYLSLYSTNSSKRIMFLSLEFNSIFENLVRNAILKINIKHKLENVNE